MGLFACQSPSSDESHSNWVQLTSENSGLLDDHVQDMAMKKDGSIWICAGNTYGGFYSKKTDGRLTRFKNGGWFQFSTDLIDHKSRFFDLVFIDSDNNIWMSVSGGNLDPVGRILKFNNKGVWEEYKGLHGTRSAMFFTEDTAGTVYVLMVNDMLMKFNNGVFISFYGTPTEVERETYEELKGTSVLSSEEEQVFRNWLRSETRITGPVAIDMDNYLWAHTASGISKFQIHKDTLKFISYVELNLIERQDPFNANLKISPDNHVWLGCDNGAYTIIGDSVIHHYPLPDSPWNKVRDIEFDKNKNAWLITHHGLYYYYKDTEWHKVDWPYANEETGYFNTLLIDKFDNKWIGTTDGGILVYNENGVDDI